MIKVSGLVSMWHNRRQRHTLYSKAAYWDAKAEQSQGHAVSMWPNNHLNVYYQREQWRLIERFLPNVSGLNILDVGCGFGRLTRLFAERGAQAVGIDFSARAIELARKHGSGDNPAYRVQSIFDLEEVEAYDVALSWCVLAIACQNRVELGDALGRLVRAVKPGGKLLLLEPIHRGFLHRVLNLSLGEFCDEFEAAGAQVTQMAQLHFWPARLVLANLPWPWLITAPGYYLGQAMLRCLGNLGSLGDYKAILAVRRREAL